MFSKRLFQFVNIVTNKTNFPGATFDKHNVSWSSKRSSVHWGNSFSFYYAPVYQTSWALFGKSKNPSTLKVLHSKLFSLKLTNELQTNQLDLLILSLFQYTLENLPSNHPRRQFDVLSSFKSYVRRRHDFVFSDLMMSILLCQ